MQKTPEEIAASTRSGIGGMLLLVLSVACFVVFLWILIAVVRFVVGLTL